MIEVLSTEHGFFFFRFGCVEDLDKVLEEGPWHMDNRPLVLQKWGPNLSLRNEELSKLPVWVKLSGLPVEHWTEEVLS